LLRGSCSLSSCTGSLVCVLLSHSFAHTHPSQEATRLRLP
jgi:hypothetical protein